jgi:predicted ATPase
MVSSVWHWGPARVAAAVATAVQDEVTATAAVCRTAVKNTTVAVAAENSATAEAAGAITAATETMGRRQLYRRRKRRNAEAMAGKFILAIFLTFSSFRSSSCALFGRGYA